MFLLRYMLFFVLLTIFGLAIAGTIAIFWPILFLIVFFI